MNPFKAQQAMNAERKKSKFFDFVQRCSGRGEVDAYSSHGYQSWWSAYMRVESVITAVGHAFAHTSNSSFLSSWLLLVSS